jgi:hypothetical protein
MTRYALIVAALLALSGCGEGPEKYAHQIRAAGHTCGTVTGLEFTRTIIAVVCDDARHVYYIMEDGKVLGG